MSGKTIVLHIGLHKTGTSSIQETLAANRALLVERGLLYPASLPANHSNFVYNAFADAPEAYHANRARGLTREELATRTARTLEALRREAAETACGTIVFSAEDACTLKPAEVARMHAFLAGLVPSPVLRVLLYTRHPVDYVASAVQENVKGNGLTIARAKEIHLGAAPERFRRIHDTYAAAFGKAAVTFRSFEAARAAPGGLVGDVLGTLGTDAAGIREVRRNESIAGELVPFLSELNGATPPVVLPEADAARLFALKGSPADVLDPAEKLRLWQFVAGDVVFLSRTFAIRYEREAAGARDTAARRAAFVDGAAAALPALSPPVREAFADYLARAGLAAESAPAAR